jgi:hypothetical protein
MEQVSPTLEHDGGAESDRIPILWSDERRKYLRRIARGEISPRAPADTALAVSLLQCAEGRFSEAERSIVDLLDQSLEECRHGGETFISFLNALFVVQRFDLLAALLRTRFGFGRELQITARRRGPGLGRVQWEILPSGTHRFTFDAKAFENDNTRIEILAFQWEFPVYANYARQAEQEVGSVIINQQDIGQTPGLAWCDNRPDYFLIPDCAFVPSEGYRHTREVLNRTRAPWQHRSPVAFWRGATTGMQAPAGGWRSLERIRLCQIASGHAHTGLIDAGISEIKQFHDRAVIQEIQESGLFKGFVPWQDWSNYKFLIEIDGNCNSWSNLFQRLLTGSAVLRVESPRGLQQWFYDELLPWRNYVPIAPDMSDLMDKIGWLVRNDTAAKRIGQAGLALAEHLTYEREIARSAEVISAAFRYFDGRTDLATPFGRKLDDLTPAAT